MRKVKETKRAMAAAIPSPVSPMLTSGCFVALTGYVIGLLLRWIAVQSLRALLRDMPDPTAVVSREVTP